MGNKRKYLVYTIFILSIFYGVWFHFIRDDNSTGPNPPGTTSTAVQRINNEDNTANITNDPAPHLEAIELPSPSGKWGKDPFMVHSAGKISYNEYAASGTGEPKLTGISYHHNSPNFAIINNKVLQESDKIAGWQIMSIYNDYVVIKKSGVIKKLMMGDTL